MLKPPFLKRVCCLACFFLPWAAMAHGDLHEQIAAATTQIESQPQSADLFLKRAELQRLHGEWTAALNDCARAERLQPGSDFVEFVRGKIFFGAGRYTEARTALDKFLQVQPKHPGALIVRARTLVKLQLIERAVADYSAAIALSKSPEPDFYLERAQAWQLANQPRQALAGLDEGIARLGTSLRCNFPLSILN